MTGDGLDDLVGVRSVLVEYWPGLGYGWFDWANTKQGGETWGQVILHQNLAVSIAMV